MIQMNLSRKQKQTHRHREQTCGCQRVGGGGGIDWKFGISRCKLLSIEWINNKVPLYSTGNYIQSPGIKHNGKECEKCVCVCVCVCVCIYTHTHIYETITKL